MLFIRDLSKSCRTEVYRVEKSNVWMEVALRTPKRANDDSKFVEFLSIHILLIPVWLVFILQYFSSPVFMTVSILVNKLNNSFVVHLLEPAMKRCFTGDLCSLGSNIGQVISCRHQTAHYQETSWKYHGYWQCLQAFDTKYR